MSVMKRVSRYFEKHGMEMMCSLAMLNENSYAPAYIDYITNR